jgi:hypothetical protein
MYRRFGVPTPRIDEFRISTSFQPEFSASYALLGLDGLAWHDKRCWLLLSGGYADPASRPQQKRSRNKSIVRKEIQTRGGARPIGMTLEE